MIERKYDDPKAFAIDSAFADLLKVVALDPQETGGAIIFTGEDPVLPSKHKLGAIMALGMMGAAAATQILYKMRGGSGQDLSVDLRAAVAHINPLVAFKPSIGLPTGAYPHMIPDWIGLLECALNAKAITEAIAQWDWQELEDAAAANT